MQIAMHQGNWGREITIPTNTIVRRPETEERRESSSLLSALTSFISKTLLKREVEIDDWHERASIIASTEQISEKTKKIINKNGIKRFQEFLNYSDGWDGTNASSLSRMSIAVMELFINKFSDISFEPSIFLSPRGNLIMGWEDKNGKVIEIEFFSEKIEYYIEADDEESSIRVNEKNILELISKLK